ncbi:MAG: site-specific DNA-methyltransferase, partial [Endomicrobiaceae bacterium]|nr:site-specific DNA-methyltransferase [Endomicrobiaceae bacterium]
MMYPRLKLAWNLLRDDGVIFISIDDNEVHHLRMLMDEIFGEENFVATFPWRKRSAKSDVPFGVSQDFEWIICYTKESFIAGIAQERKYYKTNDFPNDRWRLSDLTTQKIEADRPNSAFDLVDPKTRKIYPYNPKRLWGITKETFQDYYDKGKIVFPDDYGFLNISIPAYRVFESEDKVKALKKYGVEESIKAASTLFPKNIGMNQDANKEVAELFGGMSPFSFPKPMSLIRHLIKIVNNFDEDMVVLDFFSGSATTAQAVMMENAEDKGNRKWICVQLPEVVDIKSEAYKAGYKTIADIAKERIRRVIKGYGDNPRPINDGFKVFKLDKSNYWENGFDFDPERSEEENKKAFLAYLNRAKQAKLFEKTQEIDVVYENIIKEGLSLNAKIEEQKIAGVKIYKVVDEEKQLLICLENKVSPEAVNEFRKVEYKGKIFICLDNALDDTAKANLGLNVELKTI